MQLSLKTLEYGNGPWWPFLLCNFDSGPWDGAKWWEEVKEGASEYVRWLHWL